MMQKAIFTEGIAVTMNQDGSYRVEDVATGLPIGGVRGFDVEPDPDFPDPGSPDPARIIATLDIDTRDMRCRLILPADVAQGAPVSDRGDIKA